MSFSTEKQAVFDLAKTKNCNQLYAIVEANDYTALSLVVEFFETFQCDNVYLENLLAIITDAELINAGMYYNKTQSLLTNPKLVVKSTITDIVINVDQTCLLLSNSTIGKLTLGANVDYISIIGNSTITEIEMLSPFTTKLITANSCDGAQPAPTITKIVNNLVEEFLIDKNVVFGGFDCTTIIPVP